jgi:hypothetical protein
LFKVIRVTGPRRWWAAGGVVVLLAATATFWLATRHGRAREDKLSAPVRADLTTKARDVIEDGAPADDGRLACAVRVLGTDPPAVAEAALARTVYVWAMCATVGTGVSSESSLPVAVHLTTPPTTEAPGDGSLNWPDKQRIFPKRLWDLLDGGDEGYGLEPEMLQRARERT